MFTVSDLQYTYTGGKRLHYPDLHLNAGEACLVSGRSGSGKSTLLYLLAGLLIPDAGTISLDGESYSFQNERNRGQFRSSHIGIVWQEMHFMPALNVMDNLRAYALFLGIKVKRDYILHLTERLGVSGMLAKKAHELSRGEQQRLSVCRALLCKPALVLADEPTSSLDDQNTEQVIQLLLNECKNSCLVIASHDQRIKGLTTKEFSL